MSTSLRGGFLAWASALAAATGLLAFDWSPTAVLLLYWVETVAAVLVPLLPALALIVFRREGLAAGAVLLVLMLVPCAFLGGHALVIAVLGLFEMGAITDLHGTTLAVPLYAPLVATFRDPWFLASAAVVVALAIAEFFPRIANAGTPRPAPTSAEWMGGLYTRIMVGQIAVVVGGGVLILTQLPSAAALVLVGLKLWLDLRSVRAQQGRVSAAQ